MKTIRSPIFVGVDWATRDHFVVVLDAEGKPLGERVVRHSGSGMHELRTWLSEFSVEPSAIRVAIEVTHGAVVEALLDHGCEVFSINPKQLDRFRDRFAVSGAKDDRRDARVLASSLRTDQPCFRKLSATPATIQVLREVTRLYDEIGAQRVAFTHRFREQVNRYYPAFLDVAKDPGSDVTLDLWEAVPTPDAARACDLATIEDILRRNRVRRIKAEAVLEKLRQLPLPVSAGTTAAATIHIREIIDLLRLLNAKRRSLRRRIESMIQEMADSSGVDVGQQKEQRDVAIALSIPGVGSIVLATLLAEADHLLRERNYHALRTYCGVAPVTRRSGKTRPQVSMRFGCSERLRNAMYHWARVAAQRDPRWRKRSLELRQRGLSHGQVLRTIGDGLLRMLVAMLTSGTEYRPQAAA